MSTWLVVLDANGQIKVAEGTEQEVHQTARGWVEKLKTSYPHAKFHPKFYRVVKK